MGFPNFDFRGIRDLTLAVSPRTDTLNRGTHIMTVALPKRLHTNLFQRWTALTITGFALYASACGGGESGLTDGPRGDAGPGRDAGPPPVPPPACGNGFVEEDEVCDRLAPPGMDCTTFGLTGTLGCRPDCAGADIASCDAPSTCGNGVVDAPELCDGTALGGVTCESLELGAGELGCASNCLAFATERCPVLCPPCGASTCGGPPDARFTAACRDLCGVCAEDEVCTEGMCESDCDSAALTSGSSREVLDLTLFTLSGEVTIDGGAMPDNTLAEGADRATLEFFSFDPQISFTVSLGATGPANYEVAIPAGEYRVLIRVGDREDQDAFPDTNTIVAVADAWVVSESVVRDINLVAAPLTVTVNGETPPEGENRGRAIFLGESTLSVNQDFRLPPTGPATGTLLVAAPRDFDVLLLMNGIPGAEGEVRQRFLELLAVDDATPITLDMQVVNATFEVTVGGQPLPDDTILDGVGRGSLRASGFNHAGGGVTGGFGETGAGTVSVPVTPGPYIVSITGGPGDTQDVLPETRMTYDVTIGDTDETFPIDLPPVAEVEAEVRIDGGPMGDNGVAGDSSRGALEVGIGRAVPPNVFREPFVPGIDLGASGPAQVRFLLYQGAHAMTLKPGRNQDVLPFAPFVFHRSLPIYGSQSLVLDVAAVRVFGTVQAGGSPLPEAAPLGGAGDRNASIEFIPQDILLVEGATAELPQTGSADFDTVLFPGSYRVLVHWGRDWTYAAGDVVVPADGGEILFDIDMSVATVTGEVTLGGAPFAESRAPFLRLHGRNGNEVIRATEDDGTFELLLPEDEYDTTIDFPATGTPDGQAVGSQRLDSSLVVAGDDTVTLDAELYEVEFEVTVNGSSLPEIDRGTLRTDAFSGYAFPASGPAVVTVRTIERSPELTIQNTQLSEIPAIFGQVTVTRYCLP